MLGSASPRSQSFLDDHGRPPHPIQQPFQSNAKRKRSQKTYAQSSLLRLPSHCMRCWNPRLLLHCAAPALQQCCLVFRHLAKHRHLAKLLVDAQTLHLHLPLHLAQHWSCISSNFRQHSLSSQPSLPKCCKLCMSTRPSVCPLRCCRGRYSSSEMMHLMQMHFLASCIVC